MGMWSLRSRCRDFCQTCHCMQARRQPEKFPGSPARGSVRGTPGPESALSVPRATMVRVDVDTGRNRSDPRPDRRPDRQTPYEPARPDRLTYPPDQTARPRVHPFLVKEPRSDGPPQHEDPAAGGFRGEDPRHRRRRRNAGLLPRVRVLGDLLPCPAGRPRRHEAGAPAHRLPDERDGPAPRPRVRQVRPRRRRGHGQAAPARRRVDLRRPRTHGAALLDAAAARGRPRQLRFARQRRPMRPPCVTPSARWPTPRH